MLQTHLYCWKWQHFILFYGSVIFQCGMCVSDIILLSIYLFIDRLLIVFHWDSGTSSQFSSVQLLSCVWLFVTPWTAVRQTSLSITNSQSPPKPTSIVTTQPVMPSSHLILCHPLLLLPSIFPSIRVFLNGSGLRIRWPTYWSFSFNISPSNEHPGP